MKRNLICNKNGKQKHKIPYKDTYVNMKAIFAVMNTSYLSSSEKKAWIFFRGGEGRLSFHYYLSSVHNCEDRFHIHVFNRSSNIWLSYIHNRLFTKDNYMTLPFSLLVLTFIGDPPLWGPIPPPPGKNAPSLRLNQCWIPIWLKRPNCTFKRVHSTKKITRPIQRNLGLRLTIEEFLKML